MTNIRKESILPNGFRLVTDKDTNSKNIKMLEIAKKKRMYTEKKKKEARARKKAAKEALKLQEQVKIQENIKK